MKADELALQKLVDIAVGIPNFTYPMFANAPRPKDVYAAVRFESETNPGYDVVSHVDVLQEDGTTQLMLRTDGITILKYHVLFSRDDIEVIKFDRALLRQDFRDLAYRLGYTVMDKKPISLQNITFETDWEIRRGIEVTMMTSRIFDTPIEDFNRVELGGEVATPNGDYDANNNIGG